MAFDTSDERLSKYELIRPLGSGGMGEVYLARDRVLNRRVALKFVSSARLGEKEAGRRLVREARAAAALDHPAICPVYDVFDSEDRPCIVMQYVDGETLAAHLARGSLPPDEAVTLALRIAEALAAAHAAGIIHRDLKPQNIVLTQDGRPKLLDFGIAQTQLPPDVVASLVTRTATVATGSGAIVGTPAYMSPEQVLQKPIDGRSDLFSLGAVLFECLTGQPAFQAGTDVDTWARVVYVAPPAPSSINRAVPHAVDAVVARLLEKDPAERYASAQDVVAALRPLAVAEGGAGPSRFTTRQVAITAGAIVAVAVLTGLVALRLMHPRPLPKAPAEATRWYDLGTEYLRDGAYHSARLAFDEALKIHPDYPQALVRRAEAFDELDNQNDAQVDIIRASEIVPNIARLPADDAARMTAVRALLARHVSGATAEYRLIVDRNPRDPGAWLDLARAQAAGGMVNDAAASCRQALQIDRDYAAAHLRLAGFAAAALRRDEALAEFAEAERLYRAASKVEGQTEALFQRAQFLNAIGSVTPARQALDAAMTLSVQAGNQYQQIRAQLLRSAIAAAAGDLGGASRTAEEASNAALQLGFGRVAADGLRTLGTTLMFLNDNDVARAKLDSSIDVARRAGSKVAVALGQLQLASLYSKLGQPRDALNLAGGVLDFLHRGEYRRYELLALNILSRAHEDLTEFEDAHRLAREVLSTAESLGDDFEVASALQNLADQATSTGSLPEALSLRERLEASHRRQQNTRDLSYDLTQRAELLIRLGRFDAADGPLGEIDAGAKAAVQSFVSRQRKASQLRALMAAERGQFALAQRSAGQVIAASTAPEPDTTQYYAAALLAYAEVRLGRRDKTTVAQPAPGMGSRSFQGEFRYWRALALLGGGQLAAALRESNAGLSGIAAAPSAEYEWRMAAIGAEAARGTGDAPQASSLQARSRAALQRVRDSWKGDVVAYERREDVLGRKHAIGIE